MDQINAVFTAKSILIDDWFGLFHAQSFGPSSTGGIALECLCFLSASPPRQFARDPVWMLAISSQRGSEGLFAVFV